MKVKVLSMLLGMGLSAVSYGVQAASVDALQPSNANAETKSVLADNDAANTAHADSADSQSATSSNASSDTNDSSDNGSDDIASDAATGDDDY